MDKEYLKMIQNTIKHAHRVITVTADSERAMDAKELALLCREYCEDTTAAPSVEEGVDMAIAKADDKSVICAFGSLYYIGVVRKYLREKKQANCQLP